MLLLHKHMGRPAPRRFAALAAVPVLAVAFAGTGAAQAAVGPASQVRPLTGESCGTGSSSGNVETCMYVNGSGLFVDYMNASAQVVNATRTIQECIHGPNGTVGCTAFVSRAPGQSLVFEWVPDGDVTGGDYCANTWRLNSDGSHTEIGSYCVDVHS